MSHPVQPEGAPERTVIHDLPALARAALGMKPAWSMQSDYLNLNLISCTDGEGVGSHVNTEVDVIIVGIDGNGSIEIDGEWSPLRPGQVAVVPIGAQRATRCDRDHFAYLTCHRRRAGLWPEVKRKRATGE